MVREDELLEVHQLPEALRRVVPVDEGRLRDPQRPERGHVAEVFDLETHGDRARSRLTVRHL